jgi:peptidoglycan/xylan/chitin deacetylase (PgdA/CDA1 family)
LVRAGIPIEVAGLTQFLASDEGNEELLVIAVRPTEGALRALEEKLRSTGGSFLVVRDGENGGNEGVFRLPRRISGASLSLRLSRVSEYQPAWGLHRFFSFPLLARLRPVAEDEVVARWGNSGAPSILKRETRKGRFCVVGFPLDHLDRAGLSQLLQLAAPPGGSLYAPTPPLPSGARAVVLLLHDVEEALPGDPKGVRTVRDGIEACLGAQARHSYRATYNLVGTFAQRIPDLVQRIVAEAHEVASHGASHRTIAELGLAEVRQEVEGAEDRVAKLCSAGIRGFRSPRSRWSSPLLDVLHARGYLWNAEADPSPFPYDVPRGYSRPLLRIPVAVDDWDYVRHGASPRAMNRLWKRQVRRAIEQGCWVGIGSHPSVLGVRPERMSAFGDFLGWLSGEKVTVMTMTEAAQWWRAWLKLRREPTVAAATEAAGAQR